MAEKKLPPNPNEEAIIRCETTAGTVTMQLTRAWSPHGYDRAVELFERGFYDESHFFRVVPHFLVQFGLSYSKDQDLQRLARQQIPDDPQRVPKIPFEEGIISYAGSGDNSRTSQLFFSYGSSKSLGTQKWETPIGRVIEGMENVRNFFSYGDMPPWGKGPVQGKITPKGGEAYMKENFPKADRFGHCKVQKTPNPMLKPEQDVVQKSQQSERQRMLDEEVFDKQKEHLQQLRATGRNAAADISNSGGFPGHGGVMDPINAAHPHQMGEGAGRGSFPDDMMMKHGHGGKEDMKRASFDAHKGRGDFGLDERRKAYREDILEKRRAMNAGGGDDFKDSSSSSMSGGRIGGLGTANETTNLALLGGAGLLFILALLAMKNRKKVDNKSV